VSEPITIPLEIDGAEALRTLERFAQGMGAAATKTDDAGKSAAASSLSWTELNSALSLVSGAFSRIVAVADQVAALSAEQERLSQTSARLGLDFNAAADGAGRFVDETEAMAFASQMAEAGIRLSQTELNELTARAAVASQRLGVDMPTAFGQMQAAIESGSARALRPFGEDMVRLAGGTHTARERTEAFAASMRHLPRATDDASTSMARLRDSIGDAEREAASAFANELLRMHAVTERASSLRTTMDDSTHQLRAFGTVAAQVATQVLNGIAVVVGTVVAAIAAAVGAGRVAIADLSAMAHGNLPGSEGFAAAHAAASRESLGAGSGLDTILTFLGERADALSAGAEDQGSTAGREAVTGLIARPPAASAAGGGNLRPASTSTSASAASGARARTEAMQEMVRAEVAKANDRERLVRDTQIELNRPAYEAQMAERRAELDRVNREGTAATAAERTAAGKRPGADDSIGGRLQTQLRQYGDTTKHVRDQVVGAMTDMTDAVASHVEAWVKGRESLADAARGMLSDFLGSVAKRASVSAAEEAAAALGSLAVGNLPGAGLHAAAAAGFLAVAGLAGYASQAVAPTPAAGGASGASRSAGDVTPRAAGKSGGDGQTVNVYFGGPVIGAGGARQAAREVVGLLNDGARQGGVRLSPNLLPMGA
jgi:hypothetical protein